MDSDRTAPPVPRRRLDATIHVGADSTADLGVWLIDLGSELLSDEQVPESVDRYTGNRGTYGHVVVSVDEEITAETYQHALREWARSTLRNHARADHRAAALDPEEPF